MSVKSRKRVKPTKRLKEPDPAMTGLGCNVPTPTYKKMRKHLMQLELRGNKITQSRFITEAIEAKLDDGG